MLMSIIKKTEFDTNDVKGTAFVLGLKGRAFSASTLVFEDNDFTETPDGLKFNIPVVARKREYITSEGTKAMGYDLLPKDIGIEFEA